MPVLENKKGTMELHLSALPCVEPHQPQLTVWLRTDCTALSSTASIHRNTLEQAFFSISPTDIACKDGFSPGYSTTYPGNLPDSYEDIVHSTSNPDLPSDSFLASLGSQQNQPRRRNGAETNEADMDEWNKSLFGFTLGMHTSETAPVACKQSTITTPASQPVTSSIVEQQFVHILNLIEDMGFQSFDSLATAYYTASFSEGSLPRYAQSTSRSRRLRQFLTDLHESSKQWVGREAQGYHEERFRSMEQTCAEELARLPQHSRQSGNGEAKKRTFVANTVRQLLMDETTDQLLKRDKQYLREQVCDFLSLFSFFCFCISIRFFLLLSPFAILFSLLDPFTSFDIN